MAETVPATVTYVIDLHMTELLTLNQRLNRHERAKCSATIRNKAVAARLQNREPRFERARLAPTIKFRDRRRRDGINLTPTVKAAVDGIVSGPPVPNKERGIVPAWPHALLPDDDAERLTGTEPAIGWDGNLRPQWVRLILEFTEV